MDSSSPAFILGTLIAGSAMKVIAGILIKRNEERTFQPVGHVRALYIYPIKSFGGIEVEEGDCTPLGLSCFDGVTDRHWAVAKEDGVYLTQRQEPTMAQIKVTVAGGNMTLTAPAMEPITIPVNPPITQDRLSRITVKLDTVTTLDCGNEVAAWLCRYFKREGLRLHYSAPSLEKRHCDQAKKNWVHPARPGDLTALSDYCGYMILSNTSLAALNQRLNQPVPIQNFRGNIVVDGCPPFAEDVWTDVKIGEAELRALDACTRCVMVTVDQTQGTKDPDEEPLATLKQFRLRAPYGPKPSFGVNLTLDKPGRICVGDTVYVKKGQHQVYAK